MKYFLSAILFFINSITYAQCFDVYGSKVDCPTEQDSLVVYNNALKVVNYYDKNPAYRLNRSTELVSISDKQEVYEDMKTAKRMFFVIRKELKSMKPDKFSVGKVKASYKDITYAEYYQEVDEYRFYQRELENQIININAPMPIYDTRIAPFIVNEYKNIDSTDSYFGDMVNIPLYVPVVVKPFALLTATEYSLRRELMHLLPEKIVPIISVTKPALKRYNGFSEGTPIYVYNRYGSGAFIGVLVGRKFKKVLPSQYKQCAVPMFAQLIIEDEKELDALLRIKFGAYYIGLSQ
jgi:hypothetical protein